MKSINLGCGDDYREGYTNVDIREEVDPDIVADIRDLPIEGNSVDTIVMQDVLEHFDGWEKVLKEAKRVLKSNGEILIRVPNWEKISNPEFWKERPFEKCEDKVLGGRKNKYDVHKSLWTEKIAIKRLEGTGFINVEVTKFNDPPLHWHLGIDAKKKGD